MARVNGQRNPQGRATVIHLLGNASRVGGILPALEALVGAFPDPRITHRVLVNTAFPPGDFAYPETLLRSPWFRDDGLSHPALATRAVACAFGQTLPRGQGTRILLHSHTRGGMVLGPCLHLLKGHPLVFTHHAYGAHPSRFRWGMRRSGVRHILLTQHMLDYYGMRDHSGATVISESVPADFGRDAPPSAPDPMGRIRFVGLGSRIPRKRWALIPQALALLPPALLPRVRVDLYGDAPDPDTERSLREAAAKLSDPSAFRLHAPTREPGTVLASADWFLFPSVQEPCSVALIEALASGLPALAARSGGTGEIVRDGINGVLFPPDQAGDLAGCIEGIAAGRIVPPPRGGIVASVESRRAPAVARAHAAVYRDLLGWSTEDAP
jgi:glycosyltransferase involved in cell wall biosynthesis